MKLIDYADLDDRFFKYVEIEEVSSVRKIISDVQKQGDSAVKKYTHEFDGVEIDQLKIDNFEIKEAYTLIDKDQIQTLKLAAENIKRFALKQKEQFKDFEYEIKPNVFSGQKIHPIERIGVYTPGGSYPLISTVLMCVIPARVAGVQHVTLCSPPTHNGSIHPAILIAAEIAQVDAIYKVGGIQAIAAMAYGTETIAPVYKIVGPGNKYVTAAKQHLFGVVGIDFIAGPTELLIIADKTANPEYIAADLLGQAEHDVNAAPILVTDSAELADQVLQELEIQLADLSTSEIARQSIENNGTIIKVTNLQQAFEVANRKAPEHLELQVENAEIHAGRLFNYGTLFIGSYAAEALGDYSSGLNHTLPTNGSARYTGGLSVKDFIKFQTTLRVDKDGLSAIGSVAEKLGKMEGLDAHANSVSIRMKSV